MLKVQYNNLILPLIEHITNQIHPLHYIKLKNSYKNVD
jgi:hypothetical protein